MEKTWELQLLGLTRELPVVRISENLSIASFVMLGDTELIERSARGIVDHPDFPGEDIDLVVCPEAKAIPLGHAVARILGIDSIVARKSVKPYMRNPVVVDARSITTAGEQQLVLDGRDAAALRAKRVAIIDDVVSTGGSLKAMEELLARVGCWLAARAAVLLEDGGYEPDGLVYLGRLPVFPD